MQKRFDLSGGSAVARRCAALGVALLAGCALAVLGSRPITASEVRLDDSLCQRVKPVAYEAAAPIRGRAQTIVAIGSSSTEGIAKNDKSQLYPAAMERALKKALPQADVQVVNKGKGGETMQETLARFERDVVSLSPTLVIWQLGVNDVLRFQGINGRREEIETGLRLLAEKNIPVILLDLQYAPVVLKDPDTEEMQRLIDDKAKRGPQGRVYHFRRFAAMKALVETQKVPMDQLIDADGLHMSDSMHACIGTLLAGMVTSTGAIASVQ